MSEYNSEDDSDGLDLTRRGLLGLTGLTAAGLISTVGTGNAAAAGDPLYVDGSNSMNADLKLGSNSITGVNNITDVNNIRTGHDYPSFSSSGSGNGHIQLFDTNANTHFLRAAEGSEAADGERETPGQIEIQSPITGARPDSPGTATAGPLRIENGTVGDSVSVRNWNLVDIVAEPSIDENGDLGAEIQNYLNGLSTINHLFVLPAGTYTWNTAIDQDTFEYIGIVGKPHATLTVESNDVDIAFTLGSNAGNGKRAKLRNLTVDISGSDADGDDIDAGLVKGNIAESFELENIELNGQRHRFLDKENKRGDRYTVLSQMVTETGVAHIRDVTLSGGDKQVSSKNTDHAIPFSADPDHNGTNFWTGCYVEGFIDNGFYVQNSPGRNILTGCTAKNNAAGNIRLGTNDICRDSKIIIDDPPGFNTQGLFLKGTDHRGSYPRAENVTIDASHIAGGCPINVTSGADGAHVRDVTIHHGGETSTDDVPAAIKVTGDGSATLENITVHDNVEYSNDGSRGFSVSIDRPGTTVRNLELTVSDQNNLREGVVVKSERVRLEGCTVTVPNGGDTVEVRENGNSFVGCHFKGGDGTNAQFATYEKERIDLDSFHVHGCRFTAIDLVNIAESDISEDNYYPET